MDPPKTPGEMEWQVKQREYEAKKARAKALKLRLTCTICGANPKILLNCPCGTTQYCSTECQRIDWRDRGHRKACKKIRNERAAEAARPEAPTPPPSPPKEVVYGPAPRSHADEVRARIAAEHEAARLRREAEPEPESAREGSRCPVCFEDWDVNVMNPILACCARHICRSCHAKLHGDPCALCRMPWATSSAENLARLRRHVENEVPEAIRELGLLYTCGCGGIIIKNRKKAAKLFKRAAELGDAESMSRLGDAYMDGDGVKQDQGKAAQLYRMATDRGSATGQLNLAYVHFQEGEYDEVFHYAMLAAVQGLTDAEGLVGQAYKDGVGAKLDLDEAKRWLGRAAAKGHEIAQRELNKILESQGLATA